MGAIPDEGFVALVVAEGRTRDEVIASLGPPDALDEELRAIGYQRCIESEGRALALIFVPVAAPKAKIANCEFVVIWFNDEGRAARKRTENYVYLLDSDGPGNQLSRLLLDPFQVFH